jgi:hypothetical protein
VCAANRLLGLLVRILSGAWMFVLCVVSKILKGKMQDIQDKETSKVEVQSAREYKIQGGSNMTGTDCV